MSPSAGNPETLPGAVNRLPQEAQEIWVAARQTAREADESELAAAATAWAAVHADFEVGPEGEWQKNGVFVRAGKGTNWTLGTSTDAAGPIEGASLDEIRLTMELAEEDRNKPVEILRTGTFRDMWGREFTFVTEFMDAMVRNFENGKLGQLVPVDILHTMSQAAGWLTSLWREGNKLLAAVEWNELGRSLVGDKQFIYISSSIELEEEMLVTISLVNFPAVKGLKPVALSEAQPANPPEFVLNGPGQAADPVIVPDDVSPGNQSEGVASMPNKEIEKPDVQALGVVVPPVVPEVVVVPPVPPVVEPVAGTVPMEVYDSLKKLMTMTGGDMESVKSKLEEMAAQAVTAQVDAFEAQKTSIIAAQLAKMIEKNEVAQFAQRVTSEGRFVLRETPEDMTKMLLGMPAQARTEIMGVITRIVEHGLLDMREIGTNAGEPEEKKAIDPAMVKQIADFCKTPGGSVAKWFEFNPDLGKVADYDLEAAGLVK